MSSIHGKILTSAILDFNRIRIIQCRYGPFIEQEIQRLVSASTNETKKISKRILAQLTIQLNRLNGDEKDLNIPNHLKEMIILEVKELKKVMSKNFDLTEEAFGEMVQRMKSGDNSLLEKVFLTHFDSCIRYIQSKFSCSYDESYDISMEALLFFRQKLVNDKIKYGNLRFLFTQMAIQLMIKKNSREKKNLTLIQENSDDAATEEEVSEQSLNLLQVSWKELSGTCQDLLRKIYYGKMKLIQIAQEEQKTAVSIRKQKQRCIGKLRNLLKKNSFTQNG